MENKKRRSNLFLLELILSIFFFSVMGAVCVQLFSDAYSLSRSSREVTQAVNQVSNVAEALRGWPGQEEWQEMFPLGTFTSHDQQEEVIWKMVYDQDFRPMIKGPGTYGIELRISKSDQELPLAQITFSNRDGTNCIYQVELYLEGSIEDYVEGKADGGAEE